MIPPFFWNGKSNKFAPKLKIPAAAGFRLWSDGREGGWVRGLVPMDLVGPCAGRFFWKFEAWIRANSMNFRGEAMPCQMLWYQG
jgi:hypothetical protein